jgi:CTP-dependent riboflavin kinase
MEEQKSLNVDLTDNQKDLMYTIKDCKSLPLDSFQMNIRALNQLIKKGYLTTHNYANGEFASLTDSGNEIIEYLAKNE